jgi:hypothetical protein
MTVLNVLRDHEIREYVGEETPQLLPSSKVQLSLVKQRMKAAVHFSQLIQILFGGSKIMMDDLRNHSPRIGTHSLPSSFNPPVGGVVGVVPPRLYQQVERVLCRGSP